MLEFSVRQEEEQQRTAAADMQQAYKILVVSDSHGRNNAIRYAIGQEAPFDMLVHCGDVQGDLNSILGKGRDYELRVVRGNCDWTSSAPKELLFEIGWCRIFVAHGDRYGVKYHNDEILAAARARHADVVLFGHSHVPEIVRTDDAILLVNPGSVSLPHQDPPKRTYAVLTIGEDYDLDAVIRTMPDYIPENY